METKEILVPIEVPNIFKPSKMADAIMAIPTGVEPSFNIRAKILYSNTSSTLVPNSYTYQTQEDELGIYIMTIYGYEEASQIDSSVSYTQRTGVGLITPTQFYNVTENSESNSTPFYRGASVERTNTSFTVVPKGWIHGTKTSYTPMIKIYAILK